MHSNNQSIGANSIDFKTEPKSDKEIKQQVKRSISRVPGIWKSRGGGEEIEENKPLSTREKITYKWKLPPGRLQANAEFEDSSLKFIKNQYVELEPRSKEIFESIDNLTTESCTQTLGNMADREMQTILGTKDNKCIQSITEDEEMFQFRPLIDSNKKLDDFLKNHVPHLVKKLHHNQLYDLYRDDYKLLKLHNKTVMKQISREVKLLPTTYRNLLSPKRYASSHNWHPTIPGIFAVSYTINNDACYKSVILEPDQKTTESTVTDDKNDIAYSEDENDFWNNQTEAQLSDTTYKEKIMLLLNKEFVQRMRIIQIIEDEKINESQHVSNDIRKSFVSDTHHNILQTYEDLAQDYETLTDEAEDEQIETNSKPNKDQWIETISDKEASIHQNEYTNEGEDKDKADHHDSDTESFYNIWGVDEEWLYGNKLRNTVRNMHREFKRKYNREAREEKLFKLLDFEAKHSKKKKIIEDMGEEKMKLTKDLFEAGDLSCKTIKNQLKGKRHKSISESKKRYKDLKNDEESYIYRENEQTVDEHKNSVIIWSLNDRIFPKLRLESPEEVCHVEFEPRNGNTVIGGLINGQICIWDITGKLEALDSNKSSKSEKEKHHQKHLSMHMQWSLNVKFKTRVRPAAITSILESHASMVTFLQWIHPMTKVTSLGKLVGMPDGQFSEQFMSASMDGTIKCWDLNSKLLPKPNKKSSTNTRFEHPESLNKYKSPLEIYNNRLVPTYTINVKQPDGSVFNYITSISFETASMQYKYTSDQPLVIGKRLFEYVPVAPQDLNTVMVVGNIMGQIGVMKWTGHDTYQQGRNKEEVKNLWSKRMHDGPIILIQRNIFLPDLHLVCGGHILSIWSLKQSNDPIWWKRFDNFLTSAKWSNTHPLEFQLSVSNMGVIQFWNLMENTNQAYYTTDMVLTDIILTMSPERSPFRFIDIDTITYSDGMHELLNCKKNELICFSDHAGTIMMISVDPGEPQGSDVKDIELIIQKEINRRAEVVAWNEKYEEEFGDLGKNNVDTRDYSKFVNDSDQPAVNQEQIQSQIRNETYQWLVNRKGPTSRLGKMKEKYLAREKKYMMDTMMKKKNVNQKQIDEYYKRINEEKYDEDYIKKIRSDADKSYKEKISKLLTTKPSKKDLGLDVDSTFGITSDLKKEMSNKIHRLLITDFVAEKEKLNEYIEYNTYEESDQDWELYVESAILQGISVSDLLRNPSSMRRQLKVNYKNQTLFEDEEEGLFE